MTGVQTCALPISAKKSSAEPMSFTAICGVISERKSPVGKSSRDRTCATLVGLRKAKATYLLGYGQNRAPQWAASAHEVPIPTLISKLTSNLAADPMASRTITSNLSSSPGATSKISSSCTWSIKRDFSLD